MLTHQTNAVFCEATQQWSCKGCLDKTKYLVPHLVKDMQSVDKQWVSREGARLLAEIYNKPFIEITKDFQKSFVPNLSKYLILKKEIRLIKSTICQQELLIDQLCELEHILVREVFLSLKNIEAILDSSLNLQLESVIQGLVSHFQYCQVVLTEMLAAQTQVSPL